VIGVPRLAFSDIQRVRMCAINPISLLSSWEIPSRSHASASKHLPTSAYLRAGTITYLCPLRVKQQDWSVLLRYRLIFCLRSPRDRR